MADGTNGTRVPCWARCRRCGVTSDGGPRHHRDDDDQLHYPADSDRCPACASPGVGNSAHAPWCPRALDGAVAWVLRASVRGEDTPALRALREARVNRDLVLAFPDPDPDDEPNPGGDDATLEVGDEVAWRTRTGRVVRVGDAGPGGFAVCEEPSGVAFTIKRRLAPVHGVRVLSRVARPPPSFRDAEEAAERRAADRVAFAPQVRCDAYDDVEYGGRSWFAAEERATR